MFRSFFFMVLALALISYGASSYLARHVSRSASELSAADRDAGAPVAPQEEAKGGPGELQIAPDSTGNYFTDADIDGHLIRVVVDTGATYVCPTHEDADALGIQPAPADYHHRVETANGVGVAAKVRIDRLRLGQMEIDDVEAFVMPAGLLRTSLLGMSALSRLARIEISGGRLVLRQ